jgi:hypothetical protein
MPADFFPGPEKGPSAKGLSFPHGLHICTRTYEFYFPEGKKAKITSGSLPLDRLVGAETSWTSILNCCEVLTHPCITVNQERALPPPSLSFSSFSFNRDHHSSLTVSVLAFFITPSRSLPRRPPAL